jgi:hypothetical protein
MAVCFGLLAWFWCAAGAHAQDRSASPQPQDAGRPAVVAPRDIQWGAIEWVERRYKIEALRFNPRDETGVDWWGSDEIMVATRDSKGDTVSNEIPSIDSDEPPHNFDPAKSCIVAVRPGVVVLGESSVCNDVGEPAPLWFEVEIWEKDAQIFGDFCVHLVGGLGPDQHAGPHCAGYGADDFIGGARLDFAVWELEAALPNVGDEFIETASLNYCFGSGADVCGLGWGPWDVGDYTFTYRITRLRDVRVGLRGVLDDAMRRIGARSELEAIVAGLKSLRAPSPRKAEPENADLPSKR